MNSELHWVHYLPVITTTLSAIFCATLLARYRLKGKGAHLLWWAGGVFCYGAGTGLESAVTLFGNSPALNKAWYIVGALLGGYPLAQGTVYLLLSRRVANLLSLVTVPVLVLLSVVVMLSPTNFEALLPHKPGGSALGWQWVRVCTPLVNTYASLFLIGGAILSAVRFARRTETLHRATGNTFIAIGALLPAIGGAMAKAGVVEGLYVGELTGLLFIWAGYSFCVRKPLAVLPSSRDRRSATASTDAAVIPA
ncbi:MAG: hypothetical protein HY763_15260 [Planctomycetes bacterium]|nr:hypothetical protein [Planctomycetota bacterium]